MTGIGGTLKNGIIELDQPADWPEGSRVMVEPVQLEDTIGMTEAEWSDTPEAIEEWLRWCESLEPLTFTPQEEADWAAWSKELNEHSHATWEQRLKGMFE